MTRAKACASSLLWASCQAMAQTVTGSFGGQTSGQGDSFSATFSCFGTPTCTGIYNGVDKIHECANARIYTANLSVTGLDLSHPGPISGTISIDGANSHAGPHNPGADCPYTAPDSTVFVLSYTGTWAKGSAAIAISGTDDMGQPFQMTGSLSANVTSTPPPVFPMAVTGSVTATTTDAEANIQPRPQDSGTSQNVYVFTHAPANLVSGLPGAKVVGPQPPVGAAHDDAVVCVLAQVTADGHLIAASASTMKATLSGVLSSQGQTVQLLNNVATSNVAGVTVFVGYGTSASAMFSSGVYQAALNVPGAVQCTASLASAPAPMSPAPLTGLWWNESESGWGIHFTQRGTNLFAAWYTYDAAGNPKWYVAPNCGFTTASATSGSCTSALYEVNGPTFFGTAFDTNLVHASQAGSITLTFEDSSNASFNYTVGSSSRTVPIVRQVFNVTQSPSPAVDYTDLWWNAAESGWGIAIAHQFGNIFLAWYVYDANGKPFWYVAPACTVSGSGCSGTLYRTTGPAFGPPLDPTKVQATPVGSAIVSFVDANNAVLSYTVDNVTATKTITRQVF